MTGAFPDRVYAEIRRHARAEVPREAVGFVTWSGTTASVLRARNVSAAPETTCVPDPATWLQAQRCRGIAAMYHSHPTGPLAFSDHDRASCSTWNLPFLLYAVSLDAFSMLQPTPFWAPLVGLEWRCGDQDCLRLAESFYERWTGVRPPVVALVAWGNGGRAAAVNLATGDGLVRVERIAASAGWRRASDEPTRFGDVLVRAGRGFSLGVLVDPSRVLCHPIGERSQVQDAGAWLPRLRSQWRRADRGLA